MAQVVATPETALATDTLGVGFSGSGFLVMYFVGVHAILKSLGIINNTIRVAGASGGSVAAAFSCGGASTQQFMTAAVTLTGLCNTPLANNCKGTLDSAVKTGLIALLPGETEDKCKDRLYVAVTRARPNCRLCNPKADVGVLLTNFTNRVQLMSGLSASSYIPQFSGPSALTTYSANFFAYDGVCSNPLPVLPASSGVTYTITVSAIANGTNPPDFSSLVADTNSSPVPALLDPLAVGYRPLDPILEPQPARVDIYPGLSGALAISNATWNSYVLIAPNNEVLQYIFNTGRADAAAWVSANLPSISAAAINQALAATAYTIGA